MSSYYEVFDVSRDANPEEIKKVYRKEARQLHPDVAGSGHGGEFKEVSSAYEILPDTDKRQMYDLSGENTVRDGGRLGGGFAGADFGDLGGVFQSFFGEGATSRGPAPRTRRGQGTLMTVDVELSGVAFGATRSVPISTYATCTTCGGSCCAPGTKPVTCSQCNGVGNVQRMTRTLLGQMMTPSPCPDYQGYGTIIVIPCEDCSNESRTRMRQDLEISIPTGVSIETRIRVSGRDEAGPAGGPSGDFYLEIHEKSHKLFKHDDNGLYTGLRVPMTAAVLEAVFPLQTLDSEQNVTVKAGGQPNGEVILGDLGVGHLCRKGRKDLHVSIVVETPTCLDDRQHELLAKLIRPHGEDDVGSVRDSSVMNKLKERFSGH